MDSEWPHHWPPVAPPLCILTDGSRDAEMQFVPLSDYDHRGRLYCFFWLFLKKNFFSCCCRWSAIYFDEQVVSFESLIRHFFSFHLWRAGLSVRVSHVG